MLEEYQNINFLLLILWLALLPLSIAIINKIFAKVIPLVYKWRQTHLRKVNILQLELIVPDQFTEALIACLRLSRSAVIFLLVVVSAAVLLNNFPHTHDTVQEILQSALLILQSAGARLLELLPNILALIVIAVITRYTLRALNFLSEGFRRGRVNLIGLHPDLVEPTFQIIRFLTVALALVAAYPYIPGSDSPAFRYISLFIGFLLSLGSTSLVANIIAGIVLTYTRGLKVGDRVQIGETVGDVVDRTLLATRIRTIKHVVITIPNGIVLNSHIVNFSSTAQDRGLILNTKVTIGYNVPWRQVHMLLIEAALATDHILENPSPFVFQTSLNDVHITYEVNAYTREPELMATTYSELHQSIQDYFNTAGVEILSPTYSAWRDGTPSTIPIGDIPTTPLQNFLQHVSLNPQNPPPEQRP